MKIILFEDNLYKQLYPLSMMRPAFDIKAGVFTNKERVENLLKGRYINLSVRAGFNEYIKELHPENAYTGDFEDANLFLNGRVLFTESLVNNFISESPYNKVWIKDNVVVAANLSKEKAASIKAGDDNTYSLESFATLNCEAVSLDENIDILNYPWDTIHILEHIMESDLSMVLAQEYYMYKYSNTPDQKSRVYTGENLKLLPFVSFDSQDGAIVIEDNVVIESFSYIKGPVYIGRNTLIKSGAKIYGPCVIGENSKVAGEIGESIFHSYVNKQHEGFVGHSYICPFVNLGADTVTSDLKNNYSKIKMDVDGRQVDTGMQFVGSIIGDHSKTGINTMLNTGTVAGIFSNIFGGGFPPKKMDSFSWNEAGKEPVKYDIEKALETAKIVMNRRKLNLSPAYEKLVREYAKEL